MRRQQEPSEFIAYVLEMAQSAGSIKARRMFGGHGLFLDGVMLALVMDDVLYLKADKNSAGEFEQQGLTAFTYIRRGRRCKLSYYQAPEESLEDPESMRLWLRKAHAAALRSK